MQAILLPIKDFRKAKQRLALALTAAERLGLMNAMMEDVFHAVRGARQAERVYVVTSYVPAMHAADEAGWEVLREEQQVSESASVDMASRLCEERGVTALLRLPLDLPLVRSQDIDEMLEFDFAAPAAVIVPSRDGTGTNALLRTPPTLFPSHFGEGSFTKHCGEAERAGARVILRRNPRLEMDVDDDADLRALLTYELAETATGQWLSTSGVAERLLHHAGVRAAARGI